ncbi:MAG: nucleotidyltransferase family protein [Paracoccaceae bacterium]|tara:strand:+ start:151 stop:864 length:714 start_codon:yes stop_codon:yes gene_type:complete
MHMMAKTPFPVMIFAAGFGRRMGALTKDKPKPLVPVKGRALIDYAVDIARESGAQTILVNLHYKHQMLADHLRDAPVQTRLELPDILETGGGLKAALPQLGAGPVVTINSDAIWQGENPIAALRARWQPERMEALLLCIERTRAHGHSGAGDFSLAENGCLQRGGNLVYTGVQIIKTEGLMAIEQRAFSLNLLWAQMIERQGVYGAVYRGNWCDVGHPEGLACAQNMLSHSNMPKAN